MNTTFSSFQQDLALEQDSKHFDDERHITRSDLRAKKTAENNIEGGVKNLGLAIMVIFQAKRSALRKAMADLDAECTFSSTNFFGLFLQSRCTDLHRETKDINDEALFFTPLLFLAAVSASLRSLIKHVETADTGDQGELDIARMREVYRPFLDKVRQYGSDISFKVSPDPAPSPNLKIKEATLIEHFFRISKYPRRQPLGH